MMPDERSSAEAEASIKMYSSRASGYDSASGGWHVELGQDFATWIKPQPGEAILDLACGTGLVTNPLAEAIGKAGIAVGIDITESMLSEARKKLVKDDAAPITWIEHDITRIDDLEAIQTVLRERNGFDIISCCSALVLLPDPEAHVRSWAKLLKKGGRMIIDVPTEDKTLQYLFMEPLANAVGLGLPFSRDLFQGQHTLEAMYDIAGLQVVKSFRTRSYMPEKWYSADQGDEVFEHQTRDVYKNFAREGRLEEARRVWKQIWQESLTDDGRLWDGHALYVAVGQRK